MAYCYTLMQKSVFCAVENAYMLNVEGHLTMISTRHAGWWKRNQKMRLFESKSTLGPVSSFYCKKMQLNRFLHVLSSIFFSVVLELKALLFWPGDVLFTLHTDNADTLLLGTKTIHNRTEEDLKA